MLALGLALASLPLVVAAGLVAGSGHGLSFRAGLAAVNDASQAAHRAEVASTFFVVAYVAISLPVVGVGVLARFAGLRTAGLAFAALVGGLAAVVLVLDARRKKHSG